MTSLADTELLRARWRRTLERHALDTVNRSDFALGGLAGRLRTPSACLVLLPPDPEDEVLEIDSSLWAWLETQKTADIGGRLVHFGYQTHPTAHAAALIRRDSYREPWERYLALYRSGTIEFGLGGSGGTEYENPSGERVRSFNLISIVAYAWAMLKFSATLNEHIALPGPWHFTVALKDTKDALLGNLGEGWANPFSPSNRVEGCPEDNLLWHLTLDAVPDEDAQRPLAFAVGDRLEDAWGVKQRRYLAHRGALAGKFDTRQIAE